MVQNAHMDCRPGPGLSSLCRQAARWRMSRGEPESLAMDTVMTLTYHGQDRESGREAIEEGVAAVYELEDLLSATAPDSEISALNEGDRHTSPLTRPNCSPPLWSCVPSPGGRWISQPTRGGGMGFYHWGVPSTQSGGAGGVG